MTQQDSFSLVSYERPFGSCRQPELGNVKNPAPFVCLPKANDDSTDDHMTSYDYSSARLIGRQLASLADDLNDAHTTDLGRIFGRLGLTGRLAPVAIGRRMSRTMSEGLHGWSGLLVIVLFGCRLALHLSGLGEREFLRRVARLVLQCTLKDRVAGCPLERDGGSVSGGSAMKA